MREPYVTQFDAVPGFWQFLNNLSPDGLIIELIQNDLDAHATETRFWFETDRLICEGNGDPVDANGWKRLSFMTGAGEQAPRKHNRIGVKNHGLKTCFTIGDEIVLQSDGRRCKQTLYRDGPNSQPTPAAYSTPVADESAPAQGCRIHVPYRVRPLSVDDGERIELAVPIEAALDNLFLRTCDDMPTWFLGIIRPRVREAYTIHLRHHRLGTAVFSFSCSSSRRVPGGEVFTRACQLTREGESVTVREAAFLFQTRGSIARREIPEFYLSGKKVISEISWAINNRGTPAPMNGRRRYPIAYPSSDMSGRTGLGVHYSAPFISDLERYGASPAEVNQKLLEECDSALVKLLRDHLIPRHGARTLRLLIDPSGSGLDRLTQMTERLLAERAVPLANRSGKARFGPRHTSGGLRPVVVPSFTWAQEEISAELQAVCPRNLDQLDPAVPREIIGLLGSSDESKISGWKEKRVTFDEGDVVARLQPTAKPAYFPWRDEANWRQALGSPIYACKCLDIVLKAYEEMTREELDELRRNIYLPDHSGVARPLTEMFLANRLPTQLAAVRVPPLLHNAVASHPVLRRAKWRPKPFTLEQFLEIVNFETEGAPLKRRFWAWLRKTYRDVPIPIWSKLTARPIWPGADGEFHLLPELCQPNDVRVASVLSSVLKLPAADVLSFQYLRRNKHRTARLRVAVLESEVARFCRERQTKFCQRRTLTPDEAAEFHTFEQQLAILANDHVIRPFLIRHVQSGLSQDNMIRPLTQLHALNEENIRCSLQPGDLLARTASELDQILPARSRPSSEALLRALESDPHRTYCLAARLHCLQQAVRAEHRSDLPLSRISCIPIDGELFPPAALAFKGSRGDYWGAWKQRLSASGLSADMQELYRFAGVTSAEPNPSTSVEFFEWLNRQCGSAVATHLEMIVRHLGHDRSVSSWFEEHYQLPCLPVEAAGDYKLVSPQEVARGRVFVPDSEDLVQSIRAGKPNPRIMLAVITHPNVSKPVSDVARKMGARSLREMAACPAEVRGAEGTTAPAAMLGLISELRSRKFMNLAKRLSALDFPHGRLREQWRSRLDRIQEVRLASSVTAVFYLGGRQYATSVGQAFDEKTGVLWLTRGGESELVEALYQAIAERIFQCAPKYAGMVLRKAVQSEFEELFVLASGTSAEEPQEESDTRYAAGGAGNSCDDSLNEPTEAFPAHHPYDSARVPNVPKPGPIPRVVPDGVPARRLSNPTPESARRSEVPLETAQRADLKENQYAWHCQMCLTTRPLSELAPVGSYVERALNRQKIIEAHHLDHVAAGGARDAGNLVVLCYLHHHEFGDALNREAITNALASNSSARTISFPNGDGHIDVSGYIVTVSSTEKTIRLFFTSEHRDYWLSRARAGSAGMSGMPLVLANNIHS